MDTTGVIYLYGNCQLKSIAMYLKAIPKIKERFPIIDYFYVLSNTTNLSTDLLQKASVFIYQHTASSALKGNTPEEKEKASSDYIVNHVLPKDCIIISVPSVYSSILFPNSMTTTEAQVGFVKDIAPEFFPNYTFNRKLHLLMTERKKSISEIADIMTDPECYTKAELERNEQSNYDNLKKREIDNNVTIPLSDFIRSNFRQMRLLHTTNHPTPELFHYLLNQVLAILGEDSSNVCFELADPMIKTGRAPILPCVTKYLALDTSHPSYKDTSIWCCNRLLDTYEHYVKYFSFLLPYIPEANRQGIFKTIGQTSSDEEEVEYRVGSPA